MSRDRHDIDQNLKESFVAIQEAAGRVKSPRARMIHDLAERAEDRIKNPVHGAGMSAADYAQILVDAISRSDIDQIGPSLKEARGKIEALLEEMK